MNALDDIRKLVDLARGDWMSREQKDANAQRVYNAVRAEVLREAEGKAREVVARLWVDGATQERMDRAAGARAVEFELGRMAAEAVAR